MGTIDWIDQMKEGMYLIASACNHNKSWSNCRKCPFDEYCDIFQNAGEDIPETWYDFKGE